jgi:hypothetical protein
MMLVRLRNASGEIVSSLDTPFFWKCGVVTQYDGRKWTADRSAGQTRVGTNGKVVLSKEAGPYIDQQIILFPMASRALFALYPVQSVSLPEVWVDREGQIARTADFVGQFKYQVRSALAQAFDGVPDEICLRIPESLAQEPLFQEASREVEKRTATSLEKVHALLEYFSTFEYTIAPKFQPDSDPTLEFLKNRRGY